MTFLRHPTVHRVATAVAVVALAWLIAAVTIANAAKYGSPSPGTPAEWDAALPDITFNLPGGSLSGHRDRISATGVCGESEGNRWRMAACVANLKKPKPVDIVLPPKPRPPLPPETPPVCVYGCQPDIPPTAPQPAPIPLPAGGLLLIAALATMGVIRRRILR